jgi:hypothetical protein
MVHFNFVLQWGENNARLHRPKGVFYLIDNQCVTPYLNDYGVP